MSKEKCPTDASPIFETTNRPEKLTISWHPQKANPLCIRIINARAMVDISLSLAQASDLAVAVAQFLPGTYSAQPDPNDKTRSGSDCGAGGLVARRVLRIVEDNRATNWTAETIQALKDLCDDAGPASCLAALDIRQHTYSVDLLTTPGPA